MLKTPRLDKHPDWDTAVTDNGRRGEPLAGCDCERCFGYCITDRDSVYRQGSINGSLGNERKRQHALDNSARAIDELINISL